MKNVSHIDSSPKRRESILYPQGLKRIGRLFGLSDPGKAYKYDLTRRKKGTEIFLYFEGGFAVNLSVILKHYPENFKEARKYMLEIEQRFNLNLIEG